MRRLPPAGCSSRASKVIVWRFVDGAWNRGNLDVIDQLVAPDFVGHGHMADRIRSRDSRGPAALSGCAVPRYPTCG
jgi:hypothetical protein